jgi:hydrogenase maturation protease
MKKILVYGYGNPGRQDDGLGILLVEEIESWAKAKGFESVETDSNYQLNIEDAYQLNKYDIVIYADASIEDIEQYKLEEIVPELNPNFSMHSVSPAFVIGLCKELYNEIPVSYVFHIKGYEWEFMTDLSERAIAKPRSSIGILENSNRILHKRAILALIKFFAGI